MAPPSTAKPRLTPNRQRRRRVREHDACGIGFVADAQGRTSRDIVRLALDGLANVKHRGALAADSRSGDGSGVLLPIPRRIFGEDVGVLSLFVRDDDPVTAVSTAAADEKIDIVEWRSPPTDDTVLGAQAAASQPTFRQVVFKGDGDERSAYRLRRRFDAMGLDSYVASCSYRTILYKSLAAADRIADFYGDLADERCEASFVIFHQRFSTNTLPSWERAQPFRMTCHNGEINAIAGNENRMRARGVLGTEEVGLGPEELFRPVLDYDTSDSAELDNAVELLTRGGRDVRHAMAMLIPDAWENLRDADPEIHGFHAYHSALVEPWDGPAGVIFTDGVGVGACLDRNGLRPLRWHVCEDGTVVACSEAGAVDVGGRGKVRRGRLGPGQMIFVDPTRGVQFEDEVKERLAAGGPYAKWSADGFRSFGAGRHVLEVPDDLELRQIAHGYTREELAMVLKPMLNDAKEPVFSMGDDSPLPPMAARARPIHHFFKQRFAQVTNPPIDPLRESFVMSLRTLLGPRSPILTEHADATRLLELPTFLLYPSGVEALLTDSSNPFPTAVVDATFLSDYGPDGLQQAVLRIGDEVEAAVRSGVGIVVIDDRGVDADRAPVPSLLAIGVGHHRLIAAGLRDAVSLISVSDDARDVHYLACLLGYGADAICPRLALETVALEADESDDAPLSPEAQTNFLARGGGRRAQDSLEDGHQHYRLLPRRPDLRGARTGPGGHRSLLRGDGLCHRRTRLA